MARIDVKIKSITPDRTTYKKYLVCYEPENMWVQVEIPDKEVADKQLGNVRLTTAGLKHLVSQLADVIDEIDAEHIKKYKE